MTKSILVLFLCMTFLEAQSYFTKQRDACDAPCVNEYMMVRNLQVALNSVPDINDTNLTLDVDGVWGENTKNAVMYFQALHQLEPIDGWIGKETKEKLDECFADMNFTNHFKDYTEFKTHINLRRSYMVYQDKALMEKATSKNTILKIDVSEQRIKMVVDGKIALSAPCTTGSKCKLEPNTRTYRDKHTPLGKFKILEKVKAKKSTIFGEMYLNGKKVYHGDRRKYRGPKARYVGHTMHHWMRLTSGGIGLHASKYVKRYPGSNGCVRLPPDVAKIIFAKVKSGTEVLVTQ